MREQLSAFLDGELSPDDCRRLLESLKCENGARNDWETYHLIGDCLRGYLTPTSQILSRVEEKLEAEPVVLAPGPSKLTSRHFHRYLMPLAASLAGFAVVAWMALWMGNSESPPPVAVALPSAMESPMFVNAPAESALHVYLIAHRANSPVSNIQGVTPYMSRVNSSPIVENKDLKIP